MLVKCYKGDNLVGTYDADEVAIEGRDLVVDEEVIASFNRDESFWADPRDMDVPLYTDFTIEQ